MLYAEALSLPQNASLIASRRFACVVQQLMGNSISVEQNLIDNVAHSLDYHSVLHALQDTTLQTQNQNTNPNFHSVVLCDQYHLGGRIFLHLAKQLRALE